MAFRQYRIFNDTSPSFCVMSYFNAIQMSVKSLSLIFSFQADTDVFKTSSGCLKKVTTSYDQTRHCHDAWKKTSDLRHLEDVRLIAS